MTKPDRLTELSCGHLIPIPDALKDIDIPCYLCEHEDEYVHISGYSIGENTSHTHHIGNTGGAKHTHFHSGPHVHNREAREFASGGDHVQTDYEEGG